MKKISFDIEIVVRLAERAIQSVLVVCADDSPGKLYFCNQIEGNLPLCFRDTSKSDPLDIQMKSQLISHQCFRTIKEACTLLITILKMNHFDVEADSNFNMISRFGDTFCNLLAVVRHRGASSAISASFEEFVAILLSTKNGNLHQLIMKWLNIFLGYVVSGGTSYTRRSAGFPSAIYAMVGFTDYGRKYLLPNTMNRLFEIARQPVDQSTSEKIDLPQVHSLNVIKAILLYIESIHGTKNYIEEALCICFESFSSAFFPIRNSATMLFTVLVSKGLKSKESKSGTHLSGVTGREFFLAYPNLHKVIVKFLTLSVSALRNVIFLLSKLKGNIHPTLFPILTLISKCKENLY